MKSEISKYHTKLVRYYHKILNMISIIIYICVLICNQEGHRVLPKVLDDYPSTLNECICSLEPCIRHRVPEHLLSGSFQDMTDVLLVFTLHTEMFLQYQIESCQ
jgi:hypothetical protein